MPNQTKTQLGILGAFVAWNSFSIMEAHGGGECELSYGSDV